MKGISIEERATNLAHYIIDSKDTVRGAAVKFGISDKKYTKKHTKSGKNLCLLIWVYIIYYIAVLFC